MSVLIKGGLVVKDGDSQPTVGDILICDEKIAAFAAHIEPPEGCRVFILLFI